jgi:hypothetical protein
MPTFDQPAERLPSEAVAATEPVHSLPADAALIFRRQQQRFKRMAAAPQAHREELAAMLAELQANRTVLDGLAKWYGVFVFTGGHVPTVEWNLVAMTSYLEHPLAADCLSTSGMQRYWHLAQVISKLGQAGAGPRTLRCRHDLGGEFSRASSEIRVLADTLESAVAKAMEGLRPSSPLTQKRSGLESAE